MKQKMIKKIGYSTIPVAFMLMSSAAQAVTVTPDATASANILAPLTIAETTSMDFGDVYSDALSVTVIMDTLGARTGTATASGVSAAGVFTLTGEASTSFSITPIANITIDDVGLGVAMNVTGFNHNATATPALDGTGNATFNVGATLTLNAGQLPGAYTGTYSVEVLY